MSLVLDVYILSCFESIFTLPSETRMEKKTTLIDVSFASVCAVSTIQKCTPGLLERDLEGYQLERGCRSVCCSSRGKMIFSQNVGKSHDANSKMMINRVK